MTRLSLHDLRKVDRTPINDAARGNVSLGMAIRAIEAAAAEAMRAKCEAIARLHQTYALDDFPPEFNGAYRGAAQNIADAIAAIASEPSDNDPLGMEAVRDFKGLAAKGST